MLYDSVRFRRYITTIDDKLPIAPMHEKLKEGRIIPIVPYMGHAVAVNPTGDPSYIDGQVADILVEIQEMPLPPFVEGEPIGAIGQSERPVVLIHGVNEADFNRMSDRVWAAHKLLPAAARNHSYTTDRMTPDFRKFRFTWMSPVATFHVARMS